MNAPAASPRRGPGPALKPMAAPIWAGMDLVWQFWASAGPWGLSQGLKGEVTGTIRVSCNWVTLSILELGKSHAVCLGPHQVGVPAGMGRQRWSDAAVWGTVRAWLWGALLSGVLCPRTL